MAQTGDVLNRVAGFNGLQTTFIDWLDQTHLNQAFSALTSIPESIAHHSTITDISLLDNNYTITLPDTDYQREHSPTIAQFVEAQDAASMVFPDPEGLQPFEVDGRQVEMIDQASGFAAQVWQTTDTHQLIIAYSGTSGIDNLLVNPTQIIGQFVGDTSQLAGQVSPGQKDAVLFAQYVAHQAQQQGIESNDIFVTGHSLGAAQAEYVSQQTGLGGIGFEGTGIPTSDTAVGDGSNFVSTVKYGDVWGSYSSDVEGVQPLAPDFDPEGGELPHWGNLVMLGDPVDQHSLAEQLAMPGMNSFSGVWGNLLANTVYFHDFGNGVKDLGIEESHTPLVEPAWNESDTPLNAADMNLAELVEASNARDEYHDPALVPYDGSPPNPGWVSWLAGIAGQGDQQFDVGDVA